MQSKEEQRVLDKIRSIIAEYERTHDTAKLAEAKRTAARFANANKRRRVHRLIMLRSVRHLYS
jgi:hypothetical protein